MQLEIAGYFRSLHDTLATMECSDQSGKPLDVAEAFDLVARRLCEATTGDNKIMFIGNGGSAAIASHMATDFSKNGGMRALAFNDASALTCLGNDLGYDSVFETQISMHARPGDVLVAISSSGASANILKGVAAARERDCSLVTLSGFSRDNPLRKLGHVNFYLSATEYGFVEVGHLAVIHAILDLTMRGVLAKGVSTLGKAAAE